jgi:thioredoxin-dependent peroxiredoxin
MKSQPLKLAFAAAATLGALSLALPAQASLKPGVAAPDFKASAALAGKTFDFKLSEALKKGPVVLYFFPAAFTSGCTKEAHDFAEATEEFNKLGATVVGVTSGNVNRVADFSKVECRDKFAVAADPDKSISKSYDAVIPMVGYTDRVSYVIAPNGKIVLAYSAMNPDQHVAKTLQAVQALKPAR